MVSVYQLFQITLQEKVAVREAPFYIMAQMEYKYQIDTWNNKGAIFKE